MKQYPQAFEKIAKFIPKDTSLADIGSRTGTVPELVTKYREFFKNAYIQQFSSILKYVWLEHQYTYKGMSRGIAQEAGFFPNKVYGYFLKHIVGVSHKPITDSLFFTAVSSYIPELFPDFYAHDPFLEDEYFKFPYKNISIDHMTFVYQCENRMEMLAYADQVSMLYGDFRDWVINHLFSIDPAKYTRGFWHNSSYMKKVNKLGRYKKRKK